MLSRACRSTALALAFLLAGCATQAPAPQAPKLPDGLRADVAVLETTDLHSNILSYDYYKQKADPTVGFERTVTLIRKARTQFTNSFLFDAGDTIQGSVLADYQAQVQKVDCGQELAMYKAMDAIGYDGGTIGNHEFNYGLSYLSQVTGTPMNVDGGATQRCAGPHYPLVLANVYSARDGKPIFKPWTIVDRKIAAFTPDGSELSVPLRIAIIGFAPPPIMQWDKQNLEGKVTVTGVVEAARKYMPEIQAQHPDLVIAILHGGLNTAPYTNDMENGGWYLAGVPGIDVLLLGHEHVDFPGPRFAHMQDVDDQHGFVRGVPAVMGGFFGKDLGVVKLALVRQQDHWAIDKTKTFSQVWPICPPVTVAGKPTVSPSNCVPADPQVSLTVDKVHQAAIDYVNTPIGQSNVRMSTYFADEGDMSALAPVNAAQIDYAKQELSSAHPELANVPVIASAAAFRTGFGGPDDYTDVLPGPLTLRSAADLYFYPNTLTAVKLDGAGVKAWLETSAQRFNRIDPSATGEQPLINAKYVGFNFDQIQGGIAYVIDVSKPVGQRIVKLTYLGKPIKPSQTFIVVTNNYRASGGGHFPGLDGTNVVLAAPDGTREILARWLQAHPSLDAKDLPRTSWHFARLKTRGTVVFTSAGDKQAIAETDGLHIIRQLRDNGDGTAVYAIDLSH
ncbi:bifunctional 2',3'-cyclic-nucleotide 2'-phosphodiesterase/3'-nucleotidase [Dyella psychrodurans]|uniref:Bifunctional 2',3'-cyclic-nucleotide 2'-phosphodiesterase/3'-nucleotidase n=1 Tax=Dyella psychrodurans TaxID=1927960 RepID=A0A370X6J8_9GAMM|nr:bifunctional 2',3'-cyclic-nucleotide 2'-phosphodiesterase/3'-nucleotidase [Dyella psychrodurans]RDS84054.1 bifunctional 2',3'-cyclic-nucleotide 2'-phosphodiesterase/3'-nucleotidase [Dyella psychrodurans]